MYLFRFFTPLALGLLLPWASLRGEGPPPTKAESDPLPEGAVARLGSNRLFHTTSIYSAVFTGPGEIVSAGSGQKLLYWDVKSGKKAREVAIKDYSIMALERSPDGKTLIVGASTGRVSLHDPATGAEKAFFLDARSRSQVRNVALSPDGKTLAVTQRGALLLWDVGSKALRKKVTGFRSYEMPLAFTHDSKHAVTVGPDFKVHLYDAQTGKDARTLEIPPRTPGTSPSSSTIRALAVSPDGKFLAGGGNTGAVLLWDLGTGKVVQRMSHPGSFSPQKITFRPDGRFLAASSNVQVHVFGVASGKELRQFTAPFGPRSLAWSPDGKKLVCAGGGNMLSLWDVSAGKAVHERRGHRYPVMHLCFTPNGKELISGGNDGTLFRWDLATGRKLAQTHGTLLNSSPLRVADGGKTVRWMSYNEVYTWRTGRPLERTPVTDDDLRRTSNKALAGDGKTIALITSDRKLKLYSLAEGKELHELPLPAGFYPYRMEFDAQGTRLAARCSDGRLHVWDVATGEEVRAVGRPGMGGQPVNAFTLAPGGHAAACWEDKARVYELATGLTRLEIPPGSSAVHKLACSPDGRLLALAYHDGKVAVHDTLTGKALLRRDPDQGLVQQLEFSPDGKLLATAGQDTTILLWQVPEPEKVPIPEKLGDAVWADLASANARTAYRTMQVLAALPEQALPLIRDRLEPKEVSIDPKRIAKLIADLDADEFLVREKATEELAALGKAAEAALREATKHPSLEVRRRASRLLKKITGEGVNPKLMRTVRAIEVLERLGTPAARELLEGLGKQKLEPAVAREVRASLARLKARSEG
jgi:WD40 repeat protein